VRQGIAVYDKEMRLVCWNRQFGEILNLPPELTRVGANLEEIVRYNAEQGALGPGDIETLVRTRLQQYANDGEPYLKRFIDRGLVVEVRTDRMPDGGIVTTATDITPSVVAAEALERANATLEMRVRERTTELTRLNAELGRAKAEADEANISKTRFVAAASHDILQPLNAARLYVTSLMERRDKGDDARLVENLDASLDSVEEIFNALLDISRLDTGAMRPELVSFRIDELFRQLEVEFAPLAREKGLELKFMPCRLAIRSDRRLLRRLLQNLVSNAIKYTPKGHVLIGCRRRGDNLRIDVYDTGLGIPSSKRRVIFREFQRLDEGAKVARGLGLGLSIVERIGRVLDHKVDLLSVPRRGSRFSVTVPVSSAAPVQAVRETAPPVRGQLSGVTVLCIDNEPTVLDGMETLLGGWGCRVLKAPDLATAITAIEGAAGPLHGLLVDYHLDRGTGLAAIAELRQRFGAELPAILITADRSPLVRDLAREKDVHLLNKPLKPAALRALMAQWRMQRIAVAE
jgi:signal transduction histidine kinase